MSYEEPDSWDLDDEADTCTVPCPECGHEVYEDAEQCPVCGQYVVFGSHALSGRSTLWKVVGLSGVIAVILALGFGWATLLLR